MMNKSDRYTTKADLWSLGATLVEMIMARPLYAVSGFDSAFSHLMSIANDPVPKIPESAGSPELLSLINSFLSKNPQERPDFDAVLVLRNFFLYNVLTSLGKPGYQKDIRSRVRRHEWHHEKLD
jgi:serine/threonine protein kinase